SIDVTTSKLEWFASTKSARTGEASGAPFDSDSSRSRTGIGPYLRSAASSNLFASRMIRRSSLASILSPLNAIQDEKDSTNFGIALRSMVLRIALTQKDY